MLVMYSSRRSKVIAKSSSRVQQNGGLKTDSSTTTLRGSQAGGCIEYDAHEEQDTAFSEVGILPGEQKIRYSTSDIENSRNTRGRICRHGYAEAEDDLQGSKDSGIAEDENNSVAARTMYSASEIESSSPSGEGVIHHQEELPGDINSGEDSVHAEYKQIFSERKVNSSSQSRDSNRGETKMCRHGVITIDNRGTRDDDALSQESEEYKSYKEGNLTKTESYRNVTRLSQASIEDFRIELSENDEESLKEELLHIFERERAALEMYFRNKMEERLRGFRNRQIEFEEATRAEKMELESSMSMEKMEMQKMFAEEIAKLTSSFNEERQQLEVYYKDQLNDLREQIRTEQKQMDEKFAREKMELKEKLEAEYETTIKRDISLQKQEAAREKTELEARCHKEKLELEKSYNIRLTEAETSLQRLKAEFEANLANERMRMEKQNQVTIMEIDAKLQEEKRLRLEKERELEQDKANYVNDDSLKRKENERLKNNVDALRREIDEKNRETLELRSLKEKVRTKGREGLEGKLRDDFEKLLADHKMELEDTFHRDKEKLDETLQSERRKMKEEHDREKEAIKLEKDEILKTKERLRSEDKAQTDRQQQRSMEVEMANSSQYNWFEMTSRVPDRGMKQVAIADGRKNWETDEQEKGGSALGRPPAFNELASRAARPGLYQQQQERHSGSAVAPYTIQSHTNDGLPQYPSGANLKDDSKWQPYYHATFEYHEKQGQPRKRSQESESRAGSTLQSGQGEDSVYFVSPEKERAFQSEILALKSENEGLKAKIAALEENIELHKKYKEEAKAEMERLLNVNQENEVTIQSLTLEVEKLKKLNAVEINARPRDYGDRVKPDGIQDRMETADKNAWELDGRLKRLETRAVRAEQKDAAMLVVDNRKTEKGRPDDSLDRWSASRQKVSIHYHH